MRKTVAIDCFPESARKYRRGYAIVAVDVIRATTSAVTVAAGGGRCFPVVSVDAAHRLRKELRDPLLAGEMGGEIAPGFEINNSPAELDSRNIVGRPIILLSSSGTRLIHNAKGCESLHLACFRNYGCVARHLAGRYPCIAVIGAGSRGEFREEDQMCCAWIARDLAAIGYIPENPSTFDLIDRWGDESPEAARNSKSADYLRRSGQARDLEFILAHTNDLCAAYVMEGDELVVSGAGETGVAVGHDSIIGPVREARTVC
jgi:2-phosphosulfolactate phosphatase